MSTEENKAVVRRFFEDLFNAGKLTSADEIVAADYVNHNPAPGETPGRDGLTQFVTLVRGAFPDLHFAVEDQLAEGDKVVTRWTAAGTPQGEFFGVAPTGKRIEMTGISIERFDESGKLVEEWPEYNLLGALRQLGAVLEPGQTTGV